MSRFTFWSVNQDRECNPPDNGYTSSECSSVTQNPWNFTAYTVAFANHASVLTPTPLRLRQRPYPHRPRRPARAVAPRRPGCTTRRTFRATWCPAAATSGPPTSEITTRSRAVHRAPGTTTVLADTWHRDGDPVRAAWRRPHLPAPPSSPGCCLWTPDPRARGAPPPGGRTPVRIMGPNVMGQVTYHASGAHLCPICLGIHAPDA